nr:SMC-Scp complex subunit ScpB [uncultured Neokomagataea sp.]
MKGAKNMDAACLLEALIFASPEPVRLSAMVDLLRSQDLEAHAPEVLLEIQKRFEHHAIELVEVAGGWQFRTRAEYAGALTRVIEKPRRLSRSVMETLAVIAYHQPCTRSEVEAVRGVSLGQAVLDALLEDGLVSPKGRKDVPGRPVLWGTTARFLEVFGLSSLAALPRREDFLLDRAATEDAETAGMTRDPQDEG